MALGRRSNRRELSLAGMGFDLAASVGVAALIGWWIDGRYDSGPWGVLIGALLGLVGGMYNLIRASLGAIPWADIWGRQNPAASERSNCRAVWRSCCLSANPTSMATTRSCSRTRMAASSTSRTSGRVCSQRSSGKPSVETGASRHTGSDTHLPAKGQVLASPYPSLGRCSDIPRLRQLKDMLTWLMIPLKGQPTQCQKISPLR